ncbi:MAG: riboflavin biosynthesis protein RibF [Elusimicrobiota bacterium]
MSRKYLVTIGTFDGVHRGHQKLLRWVKERARKLRMGTRVVFFVAPPRFYFRPSLAAPLLTNSRERKRIIRDLGIEKVEVLRFGSRWAKMPHTRFFEEYIVRRWRAGGLLVGRDFAFGRGRRGDQTFMRGACKARKMRLGVLPPVRVRRRKISSTMIRDLLGAGDVKGAARLLGRPHALSGKVVRGAGIGRRIGVPTANINVARELLAAPGVYAVRVSGPGLRARKAVCNVGFRPTLRRSRRRVVEVHIPRFSGNLYGRTLTIEFLRRLRGEKKFPSLEALKRQIKKDIRAAS